MAQAPKYVPNPVPATLGVSFLTCLTVFVLPSKVNPFLSNVDM